MKNIIKLAAFATAFVLLTSVTFAQTGVGNGFGNGLHTFQTQWVDADGDGICDNYGTENQGIGRANMGAQKMGNPNPGTPMGLGLGNGFGDGSGLHPQDGTGFGRGNGTGTGICDGTGTGNTTGGRRGGRR